MAYYFLISMHIVEIMRFVCNNCNYYNFVIVIILPSKRHIVFFSKTSTNRHF